MKVIWETEDIKPGRRYSKEGIREKWTIGWLSDTDDETRYVSVSDQDGMVTKPRTKEQMAALLSSQAYLPVELL
jgi:hypothetical protein